MAVSGDSERRRGRMRSVGRELPRIAGAALGKRGLGEAQLLAEWNAVVGEELAGETLPMKLSFPSGGRKNGVLKLRVSSAAALSVQHREPQILERINGFFGYGAVARLALVQGPIPERVRRGAARHTPDGVLRRRGRRALRAGRIGSLYRRLRSGRAPDKGNRRKARRTPGSDLSRVVVPNRKIVGEILLCRSLGPSINI